MDARPDAFPDWQDASLIEAIEELRLGIKSVFYRDFECDPKVVGQCPRCGTVQTFDAAGICERCEFDVVDGVLPVEFEGNDR